MVKERTCVGSMCAQDERKYGTCATSTPPGRSTRWTSWTSPTRSRTCSSTWFAETASKLSSGNARPLPPSRSATTSTPGSGKRSRPTAPGSFLRPQPMSSTCFPLNTSASRRRIESMRRRQVARHAREGADDAVDLRTKTGRGKLLMNARARIRQRGGAPRRIAQRLERRPHRLLVAEREEAGRRNEFRDAGVLARDHRHAVMRRFERYEWHAFVARRQQQHIGVGHRLADFAPGAHLHQLGAQVAAKPQQFRLEGTLALEREAHAPCPVVAPRAKALAEPVEA